MVGAFGADAHLLQRQADFPAHVLAPVLRRDVHIAGGIKRDPGGLSLLVAAEQIEFHLGTEGEFQSLRLRVRHSLRQQGAGVGLTGTAVRVFQRAEQAHDAPVLGAPRQGRQRSGVGAQQEVGSHLAAEAGDCRCVDGDAAVQRALQLAGHDGYVFLPSAHVTESQPDELDILLGNILQNLLAGVLHVRLPFPARAEPFSDIISTLYYSTPTLVCL